MIKLGVPYTVMKTKLDVINTNEAEAVAMAAGIYLAGGEHFLYMQDDGYLNAQGVLNTLIQPYDIKVFINVYFRGNEVEHHLAATNLAKVICKPHRDQTLFI